MKQKLRTLQKKYHHIIMPLVLIGGFVIDIFTLNRIDQTFDNAILIAHILIVGIAIALLFSRDTIFGSRILNNKRVRLLEAVMVFSFGALFSGFVIFYTRSGAFLTSWPFLLAIAALMLGTEFKKHYFARLRLQIIVYAVALISWTTFFVPVIIKKIGPWIFILSTFVAALLIIIFLKILKSINQHRFQLHRKKIILNIISILLLFNVLYFTGVLPPIPLSLKYKAVYYDIERLHPGYMAQYEPTPWYIFWHKRSRNMHWQKGEDIFVFTQIFAPAHLETTINHVWEYYDENKRRWEIKNTIPIQISGGRSEGYRGFSEKNNLAYGRWRVKVQTTFGQTVGIISFEIVPYEDVLTDLVYEQL